MGMKLYGGCVINGSVEKYVEFNIVAGSDRNRYTYIDTLSNLGNRPTRCRMTNTSPVFDGDKTYIYDFLKELFGIDSTWTYQKLIDFFYEKNEDGSLKHAVTFFTDTSLSSALNMKLIIFRAEEYYGNTKLYCLIGDYTKSMGMPFIITTDNSGLTHQPFLMLNAKYMNYTDINKLVTDINFIEATEAALGIHDNWYNFADTMPFIVMNLNNTSTYWESYPDVVYWLQKSSYNLSRACNWYTMVTGKSSYGNTFRLKLLEPVKGLNYIDLGVNKVAVSWGKGLENPDANDAYITFSYMNPGTDLYYLFPRNATLGKEYVLLENGYISKETYKDTSNAIRVKFALVIDGKGIEWKSGRYELDYALSYPNNLNFVIGCSLNIYADYAKVSPDKWSEILPTGITNYKYGDCPIYFSSYNAFYSGLRLEYIDTTTSSITYAGFAPFHYMNVSANANNNAPTTTLPIDSDFWNAFASQVTLSSGEGGGPNTGDGSEGGGTTTEDKGGDGKYDDIYNPIVPSTPVNLPPTTLKKYVMSDENVSYLVRWLNKDTIFSSNTKYIESIITLKQVLLPDEIEVGGQEAVHVGDKIVSTDSDIIPVVGNVITNNMYSFDLGSYTFNEYFGNFLDYDNYTNIQIFLPFIGYRDIDTNIIMNKKVFLSCTIDILTGSIVYNLEVMIKDQKTILSSWSGNCTMEIPLTATNQLDNLRNTMNIAAAGIGVGATTANPLLGLAAGTLAAMNSPITAPSVAKSGSLNNNLGFMSCRKPHFVITRPKQALPENYAKFKGYPCNMSKKLNEVTGYTKVAQIHLENIPATSAELDEIERLLKDGVII